MFSEEFLPTPIPVIEQMLAPFYNTRHNTYILPFTTILEPSAGKGDILDHIHKLVRIPQRKLFAIEQNEELQYILQQKGYSLIGKNFLEYEGDMFFDGIIMNPPFSNADEHILHAWKILKKGHLIALCNAETIENPYSEKRKLLRKIIEDHGSFELIGKAFTDAQRPTQVEVAIIRLKKKEKTFLDFDFSSLSFGKENKPELNENILGNQVLLNDSIGNMILQYEKLKECYVEFLQLKGKFAFYAQDLFESHHSKYGSYDTAQIAIDISDRHKFHGSIEESFNDFCQILKEGLWGTVFKKMNLSKYITKDFSRKFEEFKNTQVKLDFTKSNVFELVSLILQNKDSFLENAIVEVFDMFTQYHKENRCHVEGWKTNDSWKVNRKIILPRGFIYEKGWGFRAKYDNDLEDIDKVMCYLTGTDYQTCKTIDEVLRTRFEQLKKGTSTNNECYSTFFRIRFFKKETLHLEFMDKKLWEEFNIRATKGKNWLPDYEYQEYQRKKQEKRQTKEYTTENVSHKVEKYSLFSEVA